MIDFETINSGASFYKADLHIHSYGEEGSFDVTDTTMTPENIVDTAIEKGLSIISITDHNEDRNIKREKHSCYSGHRSINITRTFAFIF